MLRKPEEFNSLAPQNPKVMEVDSRYEKHSVNATIVRPDKTNRVAKVLRDTGALQSLVSSAVVHMNCISLVRNV